MERMRYPATIDGNNVNNFEDLKGLAKKMNASAMYYLGACLMEGEGTHKNAGEAINLFRLSAMLGNADAFNALGGAYYIGGGVYRNVSIAATLYQAAFALGKKESLVEYANILLDEEGLLYNQEAGMNLLKYAYDMGVDSAGNLIREYYPSVMGVQVTITISEDDLAQWQEEGLKALIDDYFNGIEKQVLIVGLLEKESFPYQYFMKFRELCNAEPVWNPVVAKDENTIDPAGISFGLVSNVSTMYGMNRFSAQRAHGFAAERANHLFDVLTGKKAILVGDDNAKWGADRIVNGVMIQSKYCKTGAKCVSECFEDGSYKYVADGKPMQIEVPADKYDSAVKAMEKRIQDGQVPGVKDPNGAKQIIRRGHYTYEQAVKIAKAGTIESITYDAVNAAVTATCAGGISLLITYALGIWNGEEWEEALKSAVATGVRVCGTTFVSGLISQQVIRIVNQSALNDITMDAAQAVIKFLGPKAANIYLKSMKTGINIYGERAMTDAAKMFRNEVVSGTITVVLLSAKDVVDMFSGRISASQLFKNTTITAASIGGASVGRFLGTMIGGTIAGPIGGKVGGLLGAALGGSAARSASNAVLDELIEDDSAKMLRILEEEFYRLSGVYLINETEAEDILEALRERMDGSLVKDMFAADDRDQFAKDLMEPLFDDAIQNRFRIFLPSQKDTAKAARKLYVEMAKECSIQAMGA